jgi:glycosyltransferase involved in cell wall biosynthesis
MKSAALCTLVVPYFNEEGFISRTLEAVAAQTDRRFRLVLVDNLSTDGSTAEARRALFSVADIEIEWLTETAKGQLCALRKGIEAARTPYVATLDADTYYPPDYVSRALGLLESDPGMAAAMAFNVGEDRRQTTGGIKWFASRVWPNKCHAGGAGHCYRREMLARVGGFDPEIWPYILFDHEIAHRIRRAGQLGYHRDHVCHASERRPHGSGSSWSVFERVLYKLLPDGAMDWFFYRFLSARFERRRLRTVRRCDEVGT